MKPAKLGIRASVLAAFALAGCAAPPNGGSPPTPSAAKGPQPYIGFMMQPVEVDPAASGGASGGVRVEFVLPGGPGEIAGLRPGDIILRIGNRGTSTDQDTTAAIDAAGVNVTVPVTILRDNRLQTFEVTTAVRTAAVDSSYPLRLAERIQAERQAEADAERTGDLRAAFDHEVMAYRLVTLYDRYYPQAAAAAEPGVQDHLAGDISRLAALLPRLSPPPPVPSEADRHNRRAIAMVKSATSDADNDRAMREFWAAQYEAPWIPDLYLNAGLTGATAGLPENALYDLRRYLILAPNAADASSVRQKIAELEVLAEERRPWLPYLTSWNMEKGGVETLTLRGRELTLIAGAGEQLPYRPGEAICRGTISDRTFHGTCHQPTQGDETRCLGPVLSYDAEGGIDANNTLVIRARSDVNYSLETCAITRQDWQTYRTFPLRKPPGGR